MLLAAQAVIHFHTVIMYHVVYHDYVTCSGVLLVIV